MEERTDDGSGDEESKLTTVLSGGLLVSAGRVVALGLGFLTQVVMARVLPKSAYGQVVLSLAVVSFVGIVAKLGLDEGILHELPQLDDDPRKARGIVRAVFALALLSGTVVAVGLFALAPVLAVRVFHDEGLTILLRIAAVAVPFMTLRSVSVALARSFENARVHTYVRQLTQPVARFAFIAALVLGGFGAVGATVGQISAYVVAGVVAVVLVRRTLPDYDAPPTRMYRPVLAFSLPLIAVQGMNTLVSHVDIYFLGVYWGSSLVSSYNIILQLSNLFYPALMSLSFLLPPVLERLHGQNERAEMRRTYRIVTKWVTVGLLPLLVLFIFAPELVIRLLFGAEYTDAATALRILAVGNFFSVSMGLVNLSLIGLGENRLAALLVAFQFVVNAGLDYALVPEFGATGAALATAIAIALNNVAGVAALNWRFDVHPVSWTWFAPVAVVAGLAMVAYGVVVAVDVAPVAVVPIVGVLYPLVVVKFAVEPADEELLALIEDRTNRDLNVVRDLVRALD